MDGHGGSLAASFAESHLLSLLQTTSSFLLYLSSFSLSHLSQALIEVFLAMDRLMLSTLPSNALLKTGCAVIVAVLTPSYIVVANAGDSRCILGSRNISSNSVILKALSEDHKPNREEETNRIIAAGGYTSLFLSL